MLSLAPRVVLIVCVAAIPPPVAVTMILAVDVAAFAPLLRVNVLLPLPGAFNR